MKRRPCWCPRPILYRLLNSFLFKALSFVSINLHSCWPREGKRSISPWFKTHKLSRLLIRFVRCFIVTNYSSCACLFIETHNLQTFVICLMPVFIRTEGLTVSTKIVSSFQTPWISYYVLKYNPSCRRRSNTRRSKNTWRASLLWKHFLSVSLTVIILYDISCYK